MQQVAANVLDTTSYDIALDARGLAAEAHALGWRPYAMGGTTVARYPVWGSDGQVIGHRLTALTAESRRAMPNQSKYLWSPRKPDSVWANWYIPPDARGAIAEANGVVWLANGEKSVLAMRAGGVRNVIATTHAETADPMGIGALELLKSLGVTTLINAYDADEAGLVGAGKWISVLEEAGVRYEVRRWASNVRGFDANDLWIQCGFDRLWFGVELSNLQHVSVDSLRESSKQKKAFSGPKDAGVSGDLAAAILTRVFGTPSPNFKSNGFTKNVTCPMGTHDDEHPSAGFTRDGLCKCFTCGTHSPLHVARALGIEMGYALPARDNGFDVKRDFSDVTSASGVAANDVLAGQSTNDVEIEDVLDPDLEAAKAKRLVGTWGHWFTETPAWLHSVFNIVNPLDGIMVRHLLRLSYLPHPDGVRADAIRPADLSAQTPFDYEQWVAHFRRWDGVLYVSRPVKTAGRPVTVWALTPSIDITGVLTRLDVAFGKLAYPSGKLAPAASALTVNDARLGHTDSLRDSHVVAGEEPVATLDSLRREVLD
mgnify:CR=1 FL=1